MNHRLRLLVVAAVMAAAPGAQADAQQGAIAGWVTNATTLEPVPMARISVVGGDALPTATSESDGSFELPLPAGVYDLLVEAGAFAPKRFERVRVQGGLTTTRNLPLESQGYRLAGFIVTASRTLETEITAPSSSHSVSGLDIAERPTPSPVDHLRESPGVDIGTQGIQASNVVVRGFNNIFSGALRMLTDHRMAGLPGLRVNFMHFLPLNDLDVERLEVVLGPGSALYGPNTANGILHVITRSPLESQGTTVTLGAGERSLLQAAFRSAHKVNKDFAVKVSGQALRGVEWPYVDPEEERERLESDEAVLDCILKRESPTLSRAEAEIECRRMGVREDQVGRYAVEARADWRYSPRGTLVGTYGVTSVSGIELTGLGAARTDGWVHQFVQGRFMYDRWAVQAYFNFNDSGDQAFQLRNGRPLFDRSRVGALQIQNGFSIAGGRQDFTYGWDYFSTRPESRGTIYGDFEGNNDMREWGLYLQSRTSLSPKVDLIAAGRVDDHSILPERVFSPRLALMVQPNPANAIRFAYNRAFETPTALNYFLDLGAALDSKDLVDLGYSLRAFGTGRGGFALKGADGRPVGMRSPFNPDGPGQFLAMDIATLWRLGLGWVNGRSPLPPDMLALLQSLSPAASDVDLRYKDLSRPDEWLTQSQVTLSDVPPVREGNTETFEVGWSGVLKGALRVSLDAYYMNQHDFVSPLTVETPALSLDPAGLTRWLGSAYVPVRVEDLIARLGLTREAATARAVAEAAQVAVMGSIPLAVASSDIKEMDNGGADFIVTYRNLGDLRLWGADAVLEWLLSRKWTLRATYSHVSRNWFEVEGSGDLALNAPRDKGSLGFIHRDEARGLNASARLRYTGGFPFLSTLYDGTACIEGKTDKEDCIAAGALVDVTVGYRVPGVRATVQLGVSNVFDTPYRSFVGVPVTRRLAVARVRYDLF